MGSGESTIMSSTDPKTENSDAEARVKDEPPTPLGDSPAANSRDAAESEAPKEDLNQFKEGGDEDEEEGECGFCLFMKGGGCKERFIAWENCVEEAEKDNEDIASKCMEVTASLKKCMEAHADYYEPILRAEAEAEGSKGSEGLSESDRKAES